MKFIAIHYGHNATVGLLQNGEFTFVQSEERLNRLKNSTGFPEQTLAYIRKTYGSEFDYAIVPHQTGATFAFLKSQGFVSRRYATYFSKEQPINFSFLLKYTLARYLPALAYPYFNWRTNSQAKKMADPKLMDEARSYLSQTIGIDPARIIFLDHHQAHAYSVVPNISKDKPTLIFTLDAEGDERCATVHRFEHGIMTELCSIPKRHSLGYLYVAVTGFLGMRPNEDEYKVMGLAPYASHDRDAVRTVADKLHSIIKLTADGQIESAVPLTHIRYYLWQHFSYVRFDHLSGGLQLFLEEIVTRWISYWVKQTGIKRIAASGGVFMNVKMDQRIAELSEVEDFFIMPTAGDESLVFGCLAKAHLEHDAAKPLKPIKALYLGTEHNDKEIEAAINSGGVKQLATVKKEEDIESAVAKLLNHGEIVARFSGRMEWGARSLGNRSILSRPDKLDNIRVINEMIKSRDFWMPFAPSVLDEDLSTYFINPKAVEVPYMAMTLSATAEGRKSIPAALHQYDFTGRPQAVSKAWNPKYHKLISAFKKLSGLGTVLNTSFNLHGYPIVESPEDALEVFKVSGLKHLALGSYLLSKK